MKLKKLLLSMFAVVAVIATAIFASFAGVPSTTANAASAEESVSDNTGTNIKNLDYTLIPCRNDLYTVVPGVWYKFLSGKIDSFSSISGSGISAEWNTTRHGYSNGNDKLIGGEYITGDTVGEGQDAYTEVYVRFTNKYQITIQDYSSAGEKYKDYIYIESDAVERSDKLNNGSADSEDDNSTSERFVDKASKWLDENLSVKVSSATIGAVIVIGILILIFKRK